MKASRSYPVQTIYEFAITIIIFFSVSMMFTQREEQNLLKSYIWDPCGKIDNLIYFLAKGEPCDRDWDCKYCYLLFDYFCFVLIV
jgi:hypothetical protein